MNVDKKLLKYCIYGGITLILTYAGIGILNNLGGIFNFILNTLLMVMGLLKPLIIALILSYLLKPAVFYIEELLIRKKFFKKPTVCRTVGILVTYLMVLGLFVAIISGIYIMVGGKLSGNITIGGITAYLNDYFSKSTLSVNSISERLESLNLPMGDLNEKIAQIVSALQGYFVTSIGGTTSFFASLSSNIMSFFIALILSIYLIKDYEYFKDLWRKIYYLILGQSPVGKKIRDGVAIVDGTFKKYLKGQLLEAAIVGTLSSIVLYAIGIDYAIVIGIIAGICNMIPYVGPLVGTVLAVIMALLSGEFISAFWAILGMLAVQQLDNILLAPKIVGDSVGLHPVFIMVAIIMGGNLGGLIGMLIAVPTAASLKILLSNWYNNREDNLNKKESKLT